MNRGPLVMGLKLYQCSCASAHSLSTKVYQNYYYNEYHGVTLEIADSLLKMLLNQMVDKTTAAAAVKVQGRNCFFSLSEQGTKHISYTKYTYTSLGVVSECLKSKESTSSHRNKYLVEIVGTFMLVYAICSAATVYHNTGQLGIIGIALVHALVLTAIIYAIGYRSGAQVNPAVTIGLLAAGKLRPREAALYIISQIIGAVIGAAVVYSIFGSSMSASVTLPSDGNVVRAFVLETVMTFTLVYVVLATTTSKNFKIAPLAGVAIGFTLGFNVMFGGSISGGSLNPARSFGPALVAGNFNYQWLYWIAPVIGGLISAGVYKALHKDEDLPLPSE